ncbi:hypothetical protein HDU82_007638 [Entophlyctis luteolus]|nr:hypothetical protein HDU82_007638 [Entophlyctis luteolus]
MADYFDYVVPIFLGNNETCGYSSNNGFWSTLYSWNSYADTLPMIIGLPAWKEIKQLGSTPGDYISPAQIMSDGVISRMRSFSQFAGLAVMDVSFDSINHPCANDQSGSQRKYSDFLYQQLTLPSDQIGPNTNGTYFCTSFTSTQTSASASVASRIGSNNSATDFTSTAPSPSDALNKSAEQNGILTSSGLNKLLHTSILLGMAAFCFAFV